MSDLSKPFDFERLGSVLSHLGVHWLLTPEHAYVAGFASDEDSISDITVLYTADGSDADVLAVRSWTASHS